MDHLSVLLGARNTDLEQTGSSYGGDSNAEADETVPYAGLTWEVFDSLVLYGSYSEVFKQQTWVDRDLRPLGPTLGNSTEFGVKKSFNDERATLTVAAFGSDQDNFGEYVERNDAGIAIYESRTLESKGFEIEFAGQVFNGLNVGAGYTDVDIEDANGDTNLYSNSVVKIIRYI